MSRQERGDRAGKEVKDNTRRIREGNVHKRNGCEGEERVKNRRVNEKAPEREARNENQE